jgi:hypothetical protein
LPSASRCSATSKLIFMGEQMAALEVQEGIALQDRWSLPAADHEHLRSRGRAEKKMLVDVVLTERFGGTSTSMR